MKVTDVKKVLILGSGTLGLRVGLQAAISGFEVNMYDISEQIFEKAKSIHQDILRKLVKAGKIQEAEIGAIVGRIHWTTDPETAAQGVDFVNESVTEEVELKQKVWEQFGKLCPSHAVLTTNTSYLLPSMFAEASGRPGQFCAFHFHDVFLANVVDIMPHPGTEPWIIAFLEEMGRKLWQIPVVMQRESSGYIFNSMLLQLIGAAGHLVTADVATIEQVDRSWMGNFKMPVGPFGMLDEIGLDTAWHITKKLKDDKSKRFAALLHQYIEQGKLGVKTGEGFYKYPKPRFRDADFLS